MVFEAVPLAKLRELYDLCNDCANMGAVRCVPQCPTDAIVKE